MGNEKHTWGGSRGGGRPKAPYKTETRRVPVPLLEKVDLMIKNFKNDLQKTAKP